MLAAPAVGLAQPAGRRPPKRIAICLRPSMAPDPIGPSMRWYAKEFARHGLVEGDDIELMVLRPKSLKAEDYVATIRQAISFRAEVIVAHMHGPFAKKIVLPMTRDTPLVLFGADDGSEDSIEMLNRRGENVTGFMYSIFELIRKRFELMKELRPRAKRAALVNPQALMNMLPGFEAERRRAQEKWAVEGSKLGLEFSFIEVPEDVSSAALVRALRDARIDLAEISAYWEDRPEFWGPLSINGIAASGVGAVSARDGALVGGWSVGAGASAVRLAAKIVRGQRAAALPVERPREFGLAINLRTARTLGITVPQSLLVRANEVFE